MIWFDYIYSTECAEAISPHLNQSIATGLHSIQPGVLLNCELDESCHCFSVFSAKIEANNFSQIDLPILLDGPYVSTAYSLPAH